MKMLLLVCASFALGACATIKPYEKEYLLHPLMDDSQIGSLTSDVMGVSCSTFEKLAAGAPGSSGASSCPTCGG
jgi:hypothetical protein